ncbi:hypothetical protein MTR67_002283 [Solanum verrucosum]|uniref:PUM-HD domain-containing protein n=1 Tax=Solanum verrucosum TaxID=315347 RepID=A0AAF0PQ55_SOLVR|nr:hypothetical protein MTR67_002283 [Solanum verrucosum]
MVQHLVGLKFPRVTHIFIDRLQGNFLTLSGNKYASNVVEKIIHDSREEHSKRIIIKLLSNPSGSMLLMDTYGNFVIQSSPQRVKRAGARDDKGNPIIRDYYSNPLIASGNTHDDMLFAKLETVYIGCSDPGSSVVSFIIFFQIPCLVNGLPVWSQWLVFNRGNARARKGLVLDPMCLLLRVAAMENAD